MTSEPAAVTVDAPPGESALVATHLSKRFGSRVAFDDVSFEVGYGEVDVRAAQQLTVLATLPRPPLSRSCR